MSIQVCVDWAEESYQECSRWEDRGYSACDDWDDRCCDWWPCSWGCKLITWVCVAWVWISNIVCVAWTTIVTAVCVAWEVISVIVTPLTWLVEIILAIPIIGRLIDEIINLVTMIVWRVVGLIDAVLTLIGIRPLKKLRLCIVILRDEKGNPTTTAATLQPAIDTARQIYRDAANIELLVEGIHTVSDPTPTHSLDVECNVGAWGEDLWLPGTYFQATSAWHCATGGLGRIIGYANPVVVFCVRSIPGSTAGCALGPLTDYLTIEGRNPVCLAHEIAHKVGLWHCCPATNLANSACGGTQLDWWQVTIARNSEFVTYI
jgi:hypothetical protein